MAAKRTDEINEKTSPFPLNRQVFTNNMFMAADSTDLPEDVPSPNETLMQEQLLLFDRHQTPPPSTSYLTPPTSKE